MDEIVAFVFIVYFLFMPLGGSIATEHLNKKDFKTYGEYYDEVFFHGLFYLYYVIIITIKHLRSETNKDID